MIRYWLRTRDQGWQLKGAINTVGASATGMVTLIVIWTKFAEGAWIVMVAIPLLVLAFLGINRHYRRFARRLRFGVSAVRTAGEPTNQTLLWVESLDVATEGALWYARMIGNERAGPRVARAGQAHRSGHSCPLVGLRAGGAETGDPRN